MPDLLKSIAISAAANAVSLGFAAWIFDRFDIRFGWFLVAVVLFTALTVLLRGIVVNTVNRFARGYTILGGLVLTFLGLLLTEVVVPESGFFIDGWGTWLGVTLIVWAAGVAYGEVDSSAPAPKSQ
ncbi:phage holin family protein [Aeromicrobium stalagmiti]|uniref:phage holin family protein n=1 Tax=Aeromicrobium stalagmiti TaxID=2738988 RepID=UPI0015696D7E|nr:phage holin family protein [Aeromicrobium stalagmiti]NRQ49882.1 phage holin family protein [Aeromicrobium stalagmiti]